MPDDMIRQSPSDIPYLSSKDLTLADIMREIKSMNERVGGLNEKVEELTIAVTGNGRPMEGLAVRTTLMERNFALGGEWHSWRRWVDWRFWGHLFLSIIILILLLINIILQVFGSQ